MKRDRFLDADELKRFFQALHEEPNATIRDCLMIALLTGARRWNCYSMAWEDINFDEAFWRIPDTKGGEPVVVPLVPAAMDILRERLELANEDCPWVFPGRRKNGHLKDATKVWKAILKRAKLENVRPHDLRRTLASWQALNGTSLQVIGKSLGHKQVATTEIYARLTLSPVRESVEKATAAMLSAAGDVKILEGKVVDDG